MRIAFLIAWLAAVSGTGDALAQGANIAFGGGRFDADQPVEISSDTLSVDQASGEARFTGNVVVVQGEVRMSAAEVVIEYATGEAGVPDGIARLMASGGVTFVTPSDAAEARSAVYSVENGTVTLSGDVLLTQGPNAISGERLVVDLNSGTGQMTGRVRTVIGGTR